MDEKIDTKYVLDNISEQENCYIDVSDDYRTSLVHADAIISDRSALMVEAGALDVPVLYMSNADYQEPLTEAVFPLVDSYEQGTTCQDMVDFVNRIRQGLDLKKKQRNKAFHQCVPYFDGKCGERIKDDIIESLKTETEK